MTFFYKKLDISGKNVAITGAAGSIGSKVAFEMAELGANIALVDINSEGLKNILDKIKNNKDENIIIKSDLTKPDEVRNAFQSISKSWGSIDVLINCIGTFGSGKEAENLNEFDWDKDIDINLKSVFFCCKEACNQMKKNNYGKIINFSSQSGYNYIKGTPKTIYIVI